MSVTKRARSSTPEPHAEGLDLFLSSTNQTGYKCVSFNSASKSYPFEVRVWRDGRKEQLGSFGTSLEAATAFATYMRDQANSDQEAEPQTEEESSEAAPVRVKGLGADVEGDGEERVLEVVDVDNQHKPQRLMPVTQGQSSNAVNPAFLTA